MTEPKHYHGGMSPLSVQAQGLLWCLFLALICTAIVHGVKLAIIGYRSMNKKEEPKKAEPAPEPVYYLVEKKKKRSKAEYSEPKQISFQ